MPTEDKLDHATPLRLPRFGISPNQKQTRLECDGLFRQLKFLPRHFTPQRKVNSRQPRIQEGGPPCHDRIMAADTSTIGHVVSVGNLSVLLFGCISRSCVWPHTQALTAVVVGCGTHDLRTCAFCGNCMPRPAWVRWAHPLEVEAQCEIHCRQLLTASFWSNLSPT